MNLIIRKATIDDAPILFNWRNDELTRRLSKNTNVVKWNEHVVWLKNV
jgi:hypothetical protein